MTNTDAYTALDHLTRSGGFDFTANGINSFHFFMLATPAEYKVMFDALYPHIEMRGCVTLTWDLSEDTEFGKVKLTVWDDMDSAIRVSVAEAYCAINDIPLPPEVEETVRHTSCVVCELDVEVWTDDGTGVVTAIDRGGNVRCFGTTMFHKPRA